MANNGNNGKRAAGYVRVSTQIQVKGQSLKEQTAKITDYCRAGKHELVEIFEDKGRSGDAEIAERPGLRDMIRAAESGDFDVLLITRWDRFSRELLQTLIVEQRLKSHGVEIVAVEQDTGGLDEPIAELIRNVLAAVGQFDKALTVKKMSNGKRRKFEDGIGPASGPAAFGFTTTGPRGNRVLVPDPAEQETIGIIRKLRQAGKGYGAIALVLNGERKWRGEDLSRPTRRGGKWTRQQVWNVMHTLHGQGKMSYGGKVKRIKKPDAGE